MNEYIKKNISKIISVFLLIQPFIDLITGVCIHTFNLNLTFGIIIRILFLIFICYIVIFTFKKKNILIPYLIIGLYFIFYIIGTLLYKDSSYFFEIQNIVKVFYFPILFVSLYAIKDNIRISNLTLFTVIFFYLILIFIPTVLGIGYKSYEITKAGTLGFFNSANEISGIISILTPILFIIFYESKKIIPIVILSIMYLIVILMMGTKTPLLSLGITLFVSIIFFGIKLLKAKKYKQVFISLIIILLGCLSLLLIIPKTNFYKNIRTHLDFLGLESITDVFKDEKLIDHFIFSSRLKFLSKKSKIYNKSNIYQKTFGIGYINNNKTTKMIEMDYFDIFYSHGVIGFIIFFIITLYILYKILEKKKKTNYQDCMLHTSLILILFLSFFTGHIIISPSVSSLCIILILSLSKRNKTDILFVYEDNKKLLNEIDFNKYNVTTILEKDNKSLDKEIIIYKYNINNNNKLLYNIRLLNYKIFNYHNYDYSLYNKKDNNIKELASVSSINNIYYDKNKIGSIETIIK